MIKTMSREKTEKKKYFPYIVKDSLFGSIYFCDFNIHTKTAKEIKIPSPEWLNESLLSWLHIPIA